MPNETILGELQETLTRLVALGGQSEQTAILTNATVIDAAPTGLTGRIIVQDPRDGDYIPALTVPDVTYSVNDLVNVLFITGTEPLAYQHGSGSTTGNLRVKEVWESDFGGIALTTDTDGNVTANAGFLATNYINLSSVGTWDGGIGDLTMSAGNLTIPDDLIHNGDADTLLSFTDDDILFQAGGVTLFQLTEAVQDVVDIGDVAGTGDVDIDFSNGQMFLEGSTGQLGLGTNTIPVGGNGLALFAVHGGATVATGPHVQYTNSIDDYPMRQDLFASHDNIMISYDAYYDGTFFRSADAGSNVQLRKLQDRFVIYYDSGVAQGAILTWNAGLVMDLTNGYIGLNQIPPSTPLDIDTGSNSAGIRIRGLAETVEIADIYVAANGPFVLDNTAGTGTAAYIDLRPEDDNFGFILRDGSGGGTTAFLNTYVVDTTIDYVNWIIDNNKNTLAFVLTAQRNIGLQTATQFGSGAGVFGVADATTNPSANPTGGGVLYSTGGAGTWRGSGGTTTTFGPAEPHCPTCGRDAVLNMYNENEGWHITICWTCFLRKIMGDNLEKPEWIIKAEGI